MAKAGWHIYIQDNGETAEYGVFSLRENPVSLPLADVLELEQGRLKEDDARSILIERIHAKEVILRSSSGSTLTVAFSTTQDAPFDPARIEALATIATEDSKTDDYPEYYARMMHRILANCHGTIIVCLADGADLEKIGLRDGTMLKDPIEILPAFQQFTTSGSAEAVMELVRLEALLDGFINSDGLVAVDTRGAILGYRLFYRPTSEDESEKPTSAKKAKAKPVAKPKEGSAPIIGGARRRAYEGVKSQVGSGVLGVLFRSQDGVVEYKGSK